MTLEMTIKELEGMIRAAESEESDQIGFLKKLYLIGEISGCRKSIEILRNALGEGVDANDAKGSLWARAHEFDRLCVYGESNPDQPFFGGQSAAFHWAIDMLDGKVKAGEECDCEEEAMPSREIFLSVLKAGSPLFSVMYCPDWKSVEYIDWRETGIRDPNGSSYGEAVIRSAEELDIALSNGVAAFSFKPHMVGITAFISPETIASEWPFADAPVSASLPTGQIVAFYKERDAEEALSRARERGFVFSNNRPTLLRGPLMPGACWRKNSRTCFVPGSVFGSACLAPKGDFVSLLKEAEK